MIRFDYIKDKIWQAHFSDWAVTQNQFQSGLDFQMSLEFIGTASPEINWARMCPPEASPNADQYPAANFPDYCSPMEGNASDSQNRFAGKRHFTEFYANAQCKRLG